MKIFKSFFLFALLILSFSLQANNDQPQSLFRVTTVITDNNAITYQLTNLQEMVTAVRITSIDGKATYYHTTIKKHHGFREKLDMGQLADGRYIFQVEQGETVKQQVILIRNQQVNLSKITG